jgi:hypothetical protein
VAELTRQMDGRSEKGNYCMNSPETPAFYFARSDRFASAGSRM